ncbi:hypothetical protein BKA56DRAFT_606405 [Ilyonectria sp. MPI-CAGE-AT-0026]|nr:hypothetical protein BKA56DRAFT_606405 [Ilyonectria sp. MPI-CAGE-AT-0026]
MQFQETGPDQAMDIEQSETTKWLQHTGWPQLFRNRPLDIIAASTLQPGPAWNEDYLLGSWQGTQGWSSVAVEAITFRGHILDNVTFLSFPSYLRPHRRPCDHDAGL